MSTQPIPKVSKSVRLQQELDIALQENAALQEKLTEASQAAEPAPMQTINFQPQLLGVSGKEITKKQVDAFEQHLYKAEIAKVKFNADSFINKDHINMLDQLCMEKYPSWKTQPWREVIRILREVCDTEKGASSLVDTFRRQHKKTFDFFQAMENGSEIQSFILQVGGIFSKTTQLTEEEVLSTKKELIKFHRNSWQKEGMEFNCSYREGLISELDKSKARLESGEWDHFCSIVIAYMREKVNLRIQSRSSTSINAKQAKVD